MAGELHALNIETESLQADPAQQQTHSPGHELSPGQPPRHAPEHPMARGQPVPWAARPAKEGGPTAPPLRRAGGLCHRKCTRDSPQWGDTLCLGVLCHPARSASRHHSAFLNIFIATTGTNREKKKVKMPSTNLSYNLMYDGNAQMQWIWELMVEERNRKESMCKGTSERKRCCSISYRHL